VKPEPEDIVEWPDSTQCLYEELEGYLTFMSDDYTIRSDLTKSGDKE